MKTIKFLVLAFIGLCCIVDVFLQSPPAPPSNWTELFTKFPRPVISVVGASSVLHYNLALITTPKYDGFVLKRDMQAIQQTAAEYGVSAESKVKIDELSALIDKMVSAKKYDPQLIKQKLFDFLITLSKGQSKPTVKPATV
jgi:hypothetical protein